MSEETGTGEEVFVVHRWPQEMWDRYPLLGDDIYFPINHSQFRGLLGRVLTHLDMMGLTDRARRAARTLLVQDLWRWWGDAAENAATAAKGCIAPVVFDPGNPGQPETRRSNRWGYESEDAYLASLEPNEPDVAGRLDRTELPSDSQPSPVRRGGV